MHSPNPRRAQWDADVAVRVAVFLRRIANRSTASSPESHSKRNFWSAGTDAATPASGQGGPEKCWDTSPLRLHFPLLRHPPPRRKILMASKALLVRLEAKPGKESAVEEFLVSALPLVEQEPDTKPWFAVRFGPSTFGIIDAFPNDAAREAHLGGAVGKALAERADELFASPPEISDLDVLANKL